jgi:hypothetical protein
MEPKLKKVYDLSTREAKLVLLWLSVYVIGTLIGTIGLVSLLNKSPDGLSPIPDERVMAIFFFIAALITWAILILFINPTKHLAAFVGLGCIIMSAVASFFCDWMLTVLSGNWVGVPTSENIALYVIYLVSKRFSMFAI